MYMHIVYTRILHADFLSFEQPGQLHEYMYVAIIDTRHMCTCSCGYYVRQKVGIFLVEMMYMDANIDICAYNTTCILE